MPPSTNHDPERHVLALQVLKVLVSFGVAVSIIDYLDGRYIKSAGDAAIVIIASLVLYLAREPGYARLPSKSSVVLLVGMCLGGTFFLLPQYLENAVWVSIFPFVYFYLTGLRTGMLLSMLCVATMPVSYSIFPLFSDAPRITFYSLLQVIGAFLLSTVLAYKYEQARSRQETMLRHSAECDPLTGLLNRRGFSAISGSVVRHALHSQQSFAVVLFDIDDFKQVNDTQGHDAGDQLLKEFAALLQQYTRSTDLIARWGGEEFILLLTHSDLDGAHAVTEKIRSAISDYPFTAGSHTASFGIAFHEQNESMDATINRADQAMYQAKRNGKNKVEVFMLQPA